MKKIIKPKGSGKTTELIKISHDTWNYIVCVDSKRANFISKLANELNIDIPYPITVNEIQRHGYNGQGIKGFLIDDLCDVMQAFMPDVCINAITMSSES